MHLLDIQHIYQINSDFNFMNTSIKKSFFLIYKNTQVNVRKISWQLLFSVQLFTIHLHSHTVQLMCI